MSVCLSKADQAIPALGLGTCGAPNPPKANGNPIVLSPINWKKLDTTLVAAQLIDLRDSVNQRREQCGLAKTVWVDAKKVDVGSVIYAEHITEIRDSIKELYKSQALMFPTLTDENIVSKETIIKNEHMTELRDALDNLKTCVASCSPGLILVNGSCVKDFAAININSFRGVKSYCLGRFKKCVLTNSVYDGDGIGFCQVVQDPATLAWGALIGDEGKKAPQRCAYACSNLDEGLKPGSTCINSKGFTGVISAAGKCCTGLRADKRSRGDITCE